MSILKLTGSNYYSQKANEQYLSVSQYKSFFGTLAYKGCEACAMAQIKGEYKKEPTKDMLIGSYIDSYFEGSLDNFKQNNPQIFNSRIGALKAEFEHANEIIARIEKDKKFMQYMSGDKQTIMTGKILGAMWKIKMDSYIKNKAIVDLKIVKDIYERFYSKESGPLNFIQARGYDFQLAIYQKVVEINTGLRLPCFIAAADKGSTPNIEIIQIKQGELDGTLAGLEYGIKRIRLLKSGAVQPDRCGRCEYCKETKVIKHPITMGDLLNE